MAAVTDTTFPSRIRYYTSQTRPVAQYIKATGRIQARHSNSMEKCRFGQVWAHLHNVNQAKASSTMACVFDHIEGL
jgi:hypothetical protein